MNKMIWGVLILGIGVGFGYWFGGHVRLSSVEPLSEAPIFYRSPKDPLVTSPVPAKDPMGMDYVPVYADKTDSASPEILFYRSSMNPDVTSPVPAKDAMGMDYVPVYADANQGGGVAGSVTLDSSVIQSVGVRTAIAKKSTLSRAIRAQGRVDFDEEKMVKVHAKIEGWIEKIYINKTGQAVKKGDVLFDIYSPKLVTAQQEYLLAIENEAVLGGSDFEEIKESSSQLVEGARERLALLDVTESQVESLDKSGDVLKSFPVHSLVEGTVLRMGVRSGQYVTPGTELYMISDLNKVWVYAGVYEYELPWVKVGDKVNMTLESVPGKVFKGQVDYIYPYAESKTRTTKVRIKFDNSLLLLRPEMLSEVTIFSDARTNTLIIPAEAVVRSGINAQVFVVRSPGKFDPVTVQLGLESNGYVEILDGINEGDAVVTSAQFLLSSESSLREATAKMTDSTEGFSDSHRASKAVSTEDDPGSDARPAHGVSEHD
jgi:Cu(I)/Ag(I) efflux system membrane fusion protein